MNPTLKKVKLFFRDDRGSLSVFIVSLILSSVLLLMILTDISSVYIAKRALTQATEASAQRSVRNLNAEVYYSKHFIPEKFDPGIPIDCDKGSEDAYSTFADWIHMSESVEVSIGRPNLNHMKVDDFSCDGFEVSISTSASVRLPFILSFFNIEEVEIRSQVSTIAERKISSNF